MPKPPKHPRAASRQALRPAHGADTAKRRKWGDHPTRPGASKGRPKPHPERINRSPKAGDDNAKGVRLQRVMAEAGVASRRECEQMILDGRVEVNGHPITELPAFVHPGQDRVSVDGRPLARPVRGPRGRSGRMDRVYVMLNKPDNTLGTTRDDLEYKKGGRRTVADLVQHPSGARLFPVGRLDFHSTGLVLMTNDGELADRLTHARYGVTKTFRAWINGTVRPDILDMLRRRIGKRDATDAQGRPTGGVRIVADDDEGHGRRPPRPERQSNTTIIEIQLRDGKTDPLDEMLTTAGCRVRRIARVAIGPLKLMGVRPGEWRDLTRDELGTLKEAAGLNNNRAGGPARKPASDRSHAPKPTERSSSESSSAPPGAPPSDGESPRSEGAEELA